MIGVVLLYFQARHPQFTGSPWQPDVSQILAHIAYLVPFIGEKWLNEVYWTLGIEFQFYLLIGLLFPLRQCLTLKLGGTWSAVVPVIASTPSLADMEYDTLANFSALFALGYLTYLKLTGRVARKSFFIALLACLAIFADATNLRRTLPAVTAALLIANWRPRLGRISNFLGDISYSVYVIHIPVVWLVVRVGIFYVHGSFMHHLEWLIAILAPVFAGWCLWRAVEVPSLRWSKSVQLQPARKLQRVSATSA